MTDAQKQTMIYELVMAADQFHQTGAIKDVLLTCFDQRGEWIGTGVDLPDLNVSAKLRKTIISKTDLIKKSATGGRVLYGTYVVTSVKDYVVPF